MSKIFIGDKIPKSNNYNEILENIGKKQKEIIEKLKIKLNIFESEKRKHKLSMLAILWSTYLSTLGSLEDKEYTKEDFDLITSLASQPHNNNFIQIINVFQAQNIKNNEPNKELLEANLLKLEKKKSDLKSKSFENIEKKIDTCILCVEDFDENDFMNPLITECNKYIHGTCFVNYIEEELNNNRFPIKCPLCVGNERHEINYKTILDCLLLNDKDNLAAKLENISLNHLAENNPEEITFCPTAGCKYMCSYDKNEFHLECPICKKSYCLQCKTEWHKNMTCQEYQRSVNKDENDTKFEEYIKGNRLKQCPKCKRWVEKISGCNHIVCSCGTSFCYNCGNIEEINHHCNHCDGIQRGNFFGNVNNNQGGLFGNNNQGNLLFGINNNRGGLFGNNNNNNNDNNNNNRGGLFGNNNNNRGGLFGNVNNNRGGLFGNVNNNQGGLFGNNNQGGLFGNNNNQGGLFGNNNNQGGLFGNNNNQGGLFGNNNNRGGLFGNNNNRGGLFGNNNNNRGGLFSNNNQGSLF